MLWCVCVTKNTDKHPLYFHDDAMQTDVPLSYNTKSAVPVRRLHIIMTKEYCNETTSMNNITIKSPDMLAPARIPVAAGKKMEYTEKKL